MGQSEVVVDGGGAVAGLEAKPDIRPFTTGSALSRDGTVIGFRLMGSGPTLVLLHGAMQAAQNFMTLGRALADSFTVCIPDRRGRGLSGPYRESDGIEQEVEDLAAVVEATGATHIFALSSGAAVTLEAMRVLDGLEGVALYEPPLKVYGILSPLAWRERYERELARGDLAAAMVTCMKWTADRWDIFTALPRLIFVPMMRMAIKSDATRSGDGYVHLDTLIRNVHFDLRAVAAIAEHAERFSDIRTRILLMGGSRSAAFLVGALIELERILPNSRRVELPGVGHLAADEVGQPELVARELRTFFSGEAILD